MEDLVLQYAIQICTHKIRIGEEIEKCIKVNSDHEINEAKVDAPVLLIVELENVSDKNKLFVCTYHVPCKFTKKTLMEVNVIFCLKVINELVANYPVIFTGDFNSKYGESEWSILAHGQFHSVFAKKMLNEFPICANHFSDSLEFMCERDITCYNQPNKETFNIDFVFYRNLQLLSSQVIQSQLSVPSREFPSDHFPIVATFDKICK